MLLQTLQIEVKQTSINLNTSYPESGTHFGEFYTCLEPTPVYAQIA